MRNQLIKIQSRQKTGNPAHQIEQTQNKTAMPAEKDAKQNYENEQCINIVKIHNRCFSLYNKI
jgi:hypothetical protein